MLTDGELAQARALQELLMQDSGIVRGIGTEVFNPDTGQYDEQPGPTVYTGKMLVQSRDVGAGNGLVGDDRVISQDYVIKLPVTATDVGKGQEVIVQQSRDTDLVGRSLVVQDAAQSTWATCRRLIAQASGRKAADVTPPSLPTGLSVSGLAGDHLTLSWIASTGGAVEYRVLLDAEEYGRTAGTSLLIAGLVAGLQYQLRVQARDAAGNWSALSPKLFITTPADTDRVSIYGVSAPDGTLTVFNDAQTTTVATAFYVNESGWQCVGGRFWSPAGVTLPGLITISVWTGTSPNLNAAPDGTKTLGRLATGWTEATWDSPVPMAAGQPVWIGYRFSTFDYLFGTDVPVNAIGSVLDPHLFMAAATEFGGRSKFAYGNGTVGQGGHVWGADILAVRA